MVAKYVSENKCETKKPRVLLNFHFHQYFENQEDEDNMTKGWINDASNLKFIDKEGAHYTLRDKKRK